MAANLSIDSALLAKALALSGEKTAKAAVDMALRGFIPRREQAKLQGLFGRLEWSADFDHKRERTQT